MATAEGDTVIVDAQGEAPMPVGLVMLAQLLMAVAATVPGGMVASKTRASEPFAGIEMLVAVSVCKAILHVAPAGQDVIVGPLKVAGITSETETPVAATPAVSSRVMV